jgi:uncharacterized damage-inducible protein DinB
MEQIKWFDREFDCWFGPEYLPGLIERLRETPNWIDEKIDSVSDSVLIEQVNGKWSVKQNIGHLTTLEPLWRQRIKDIVGGQKTLTPADLTNKATEEADFNSADIDKLMLDFRKERSRLISMFENISDADLEKRSKHPRLNQPMRISDHAFFIAEHDVHHIVLINRILYVLTAT